MMISKVERALDKCLAAQMTNIFKLITSLLLVWFGLFRLEFGSDFDV